MDFTPDGTLLYVANSGEHTVSVVSLATRTQLRKINIPFDSLADDRPANIAIGNNGRALITTGVVCCGSGYVMDLVLASDVASRRTDYGTSAGLVSGDGRLARSGDRGRIVVFVTGNSGGTTTVYDAATNLFVATRRLDTFLTYAAVNHTGSTMLVTGFVLDPSLSNFGVSAAGAGAALHSTLGFGYRSLGTNLEVIDDRPFDLPQDR
jgi:YVTN family beta-propeller protein